MVHAYDLGDLISGRLQCATCAGIDDGRDSGAWHRDREEQFDELLQTIAGELAVSKNQPDAGTSASNARE